MARPVVKKAQQRFKMVPVIDPETGKQKQTPVMNSRTGKQKTDKRGNPVFRKITESDKTQPLPPRKCERCSKELLAGLPYRFVAIKAGYGSIKRFRCVECPSWEPWELSNSLASRIMQIQQETFDTSSLEDADGISDVVSGAVEMIRELATEKEEAASNMEEGFGHATEKSEEISEQAQGLNEWADELEGFSPDDPPEGKCGNCNGEQLECSMHETHSDDPEADNYCDGTEECMECNGSGEGEDVDEDDMNEWRDSVREELQNILDNCPVG